ncbi:MAG: peptidylprolyl isomerase [bacterium]
MHRAIRSLLAKARTHISTGAARPRASRSLFEALERREMMIVSVATPLPDLTAVPRGNGAITVSLAGRFNDPATLNRVRLATNLGNVDIDLNPTAAPNTVANFLAYVNAGRYDGTIFHYLTPPGATGLPALLRAGAFTLPTQNLGTPVTSSTPLAAYPQNVRTFDPINLENPTGNNIYTLAMARLPNAPNSATSEFFINTADNRLLLDRTFPNTGYAVFGRVRDSSQFVVNAMDSLQRLSASSFLGRGTTDNPSTPADDGVFGNLPFSNITNNPGTPANPLRPNQYLSITTATSVVAGYTTVSSNTSIATAAIVNGQLVVTPVLGALGTVSITVQATGFDGSTASDTFNVTIVPAAPTASTLQTRENRAVGRWLGLYAVGVRDTDSAIARVDFYRDSNGNGTYDDGIDLELGSDSNPAGGYNARVDTSTFSVGANTIFARIVDTDGPVTIITQTVNMVARPMATTITPPAGAVNPRQTYTVEIAGITPANNTNVRRVSVFWDSNNGGVLHPFTERRVGTGVYNSSTGNWVFTGKASKLESGANLLFIRVQDIFANLGTVQSTTVTVG